MTTSNADGAGSSPVSPHKEELPVNESTGLLTSKHDPEAQREEEEAAEGDNGGFMETIVEGVELFAEAAHDMAIDIKDAAIDIKDAIVEEAHDVGAVLVDDLVHKDDGTSIMFEMGLTRNLSILPSDIEQIIHPMSPEEDEDDAQTVLAEVKHDFNCCPNQIQKCCKPESGAFAMEEGSPLLKKSEKQQSATSGTPFHAYVTLLGAVVSLSSIGPSLEMQVGVEPPLKIYWRMTGTYMTLLPLALKSIYHMGLPKLTAPQWGTFVLAACCYATMCLGFVIALDFTSVGNAVIFANSQSILLLIGKVMVGERVSVLEGSGAVIAFTGAVFCALDTASSSGTVFSEAGGVTRVWSGWGDLLAILSAVGGVGYLVLAKSLREHVPSVFTFMLMIMFTGSQCVLAFLWVSGASFTFDRDINHGLWGFMHLEADRLPLEIWMVVVCNLLGAMGYVRSMAYFDNLIISVATLTEPLVASFMAASLGVGALPGLEGWIGNALVAAGTIAVVYRNSGGKEAAGGH